MAGIRILLPLLLLCPLLRAGDEGSVTEPPKEPTKAKQALNEVLRGRILKIKKNQVTIYYDFEDPEQLKDFEDARPPRPLDASQNKVSIEGGRLVLQGSSAIRHRMEGQGRLRAHFYVRVGRQWNVGTCLHGAGPLRLLCRLQPLRRQVLRGRGADPRRVRAPRGRGRGRHLERASSTGATTCGPT